MCQGLPDLRGQNVQAELKYMPQEAGQHVLFDGFKADVYWWHRFMEVYNGVSLILPNQWEGPNSVIESDACLKGAGAVNHDLGEYFHFPFPEGFESWAINELELLVIMVAIKMWYPKLRGRRFKINCDNDTAVAAMGFKYIRNPRVQACMREIAYWSAQGDCQIRCCWLEGAKNVYADALSRWDHDSKARERFMSMRLPHWREVQVAPEMLDFTGQWF